MSPVQTSLVNSASFTGVCVTTSYYDPTISSVAYSSHIPFTRLSRGKYKRHVKRRTSTYLKQVLQGAVPLNDDELKQERFRIEQLCRRRYGLSTEEVLSLYEDLSKDISEFK